MNLLLSFNGGDHVYRDHFGVFENQESVISGVTDLVWTFLFQMICSETAVLYLGNAHLDVFARGVNGSGAGDGVGWSVLCYRRVFEMTFWYCSTARLHERPLLSSPR